MSHDETRDDPYAGEAVVWAPPAAGVEDAMGDVVDLAGARARRGMATAAAGASAPVGLRKALETALPQVLAGTPTVDEEAFGPLDVPVVEKAPAARRVPRQHRVVVQESDTAPVVWSADEEPVEPWFDPRLRTAAGRRAVAGYAKREMQRRLRRWVRRQTTPHGVVPQVGRGMSRTHRWVRGSEGDYAAAMRLESSARAAEASRAARGALFAVRGRKQAAARKEALALEAQAAAKIAQAAKSAARFPVLRRTLLAYGPVAGAEGVGFAAMHGLGAVLATGSVLTVAALIGRHPDRHEDLAELDAAMPMTSFALDFGQPGRHFAAGLREALEELGIHVAQITVDATAWGFQAEVVLNRAKPSDVVAKLDDLEAALFARPDSLLVQQSAKARPIFTLRALGADPWAGMPGIPKRAPKSMRIKDFGKKAVLGRRLDQTPLMVGMQRTNGVLVGGPGSGKSSALLATAEGLTACSDVVVWDIDLGSAGAGLDPIGAAISRRATNPAAAKVLLEDAIAIAAARPRLFRKLGMGRNWEASPEFPALKVVIDEYPALVKAGLWDLVAELIRIGRKSDATVLLASQGATRDFLGSADPAAVPLRIGLPCRSQDVVQLFGGGALGEGWAPHKLHPAEGSDPRDASVCYIRSGSHAEPIPYRFDWIDDDAAEARAIERRAAGLPQIDQATLEMAGVDVTRALPGGVVRLDSRVEEEDYDEAEAEPSHPVPVLLAAIAEAIEARGGDDDEAGRIPTTDLLAALGAHGGAWAEMSSKKLALVLSNVGVESRRWDRSGRGYLATSIQQAAEAVTHGIGGAEACTPCETTGETGEAVCGRCLGAGWTRRTPAASTS